MYGSVLNKKASCGEQWNTIWQKSATVSAFKLWRYL